MATRTNHTFAARWHRFWADFAQPRRDAAALTFARLGLLAYR